MIVTLIIILLFVAALALIINEVLYWTYLFQLKEYRFDRLKEYFESPEGMKLLKSRLLYAGFFGLYFLIEIVVYVYNQDGRDFSFLSMVPFVFFVFFILYSSFRFLLTLRQKRLRIPTFSPRAISMLVFAYGAIIIMALLTLDFFVAYLEGSLLFVLIFVPIFVLAALVITLPLANFLKKRVFDKAKAKRESLDNLLVIGITGSYGKTSVKEYVYQIFSRCFNTLKTDTHVNTELGIANTVIDKLNDQHQVFVVEMGAYKKGEIKFVSEIIKPNVGIITGINEQHLSLFGSQENIVKGKAELATALPQDGPLILNGDNKYCREIGRKIKRQNSYYSLKRKTDLYLEKAELKEDSSYFELGYKGQNYPFKTSLVGEHNLQNLMAAILTAFELGVSYDIIKKALLNLKPLSENMEVIRKGQHSYIDNTYNLNPASIKAAVKMLKFYPKSRKVLVLDDILELGEKAKSVHTTVGEQITDFDRVYLIGKNYSNVVKKSALEAGLAEEQVKITHDLDNVARKIKKMKQRSVIVLLGKGCKKVSHKLNV